MTTVLRVLSYNVRSLRDDPAAVARVVRSCRPDVVCLQEAPRLLLWRTGRRRLARRCGLRIAGGRRPGGLEILTAPGVVVERRTHRLLRRHPRLHRRALSTVLVRLGERRVAVAVSHLDLCARARLEHAEQILAFLGAEAAPGVLAVDVNEEPGGAAWQLLAEHLVDAGALGPSGGEPTFPARRPRSRIDTVFVDRSLPVVTGGVPAQPSREDLVAASDHLPVLVEIALEGDGEPRTPPVGQAAEEADG